MFIDTHAHIYLDQFDEDRNKVIQSARNLGIERIYMPNIDSTHTNKMLSVEASYPDMCIAMMGLHPCSVKSNYEDELRHVEEELAKRPFAAVGEIGIDLYWDKSFKKEQENAFRLQIEMARHYKVPFVIHSRDSLDLTMAIVKEMQDGNLSGIFHCFNGSVDQAERIIDMDFYLGIGGVVTFKNAGVDMVVRDLPLSHMVLETDAPYLAPVPYRGKRNSPEYIVDIATKLAEVKDLPIEEISNVTTQNALKIYKKES